MTKPVPGRIAGWLRWVALSDQGRRRKNNEDAWRAWSLGQVLAQMPETPEYWPAHGFLLVVSDGMGGASAGEVASAFCVEQIAEELFLRRAETNREAALREAFVVTHRKLMQAASDDGDKLGMGATLSALWLLADGSYVLGHVGDSRIYRRDGRTWAQLTADQSVGASMVRRGEMTEEEAARLRCNSMLEQVMGGDGAPLHPEMQSGRWQPGQDFLLVTDGLFGPLRRQVPGVFDEALQGHDLACSARYLIDEANHAGGPDNITVLLARLGAET